MSIINLYERVSLDLVPNSMAEYTVHSYAIGILRNAGLRLHCIHLTFIAFFIHIETRNLCVHSHSSFADPKEQTYRILHI